jgi:hypothetical protein
MELPLTSEAQRWRRKWLAAHTEKLGPTHAPPTGAAAIMNLLTAFCRPPQSSNGWFRSPNRPNRCAGCSARPLPNCDGAEPRRSADQREREAAYPGGKGEVCKTLIRRFEPGRRLRKIARSGQMPPRRSASNFNGTNANLPAAESEDEIIMTLMAAAAFLHVHPSTVYRLLGCQQIPAFKVASDWRFTKSGLIH